MLLVKAFSSSSMKQLSKKETKGPAKEYIYTIKYSNKRTRNITFLKYIQEYRKGKNGYGISLKKVPHLKP